MLTDLAETEYLVKSLTDIGSSKSRQSYCFCFAFCLEFIFWLVEYKRNIIARKCNWIELIGSVWPNLCHLYTCDMTDKLQSEVEQRRAEISRLAAQPSRSVGSRLLYVVLQVLVHIWIFDCGYLLKTFTVDLLDHTLHQCVLQDCCQHRCNIWYDAGQVKLGIAYMYFVNNMNFLLTLK